MSAAHCERCERPGVRGNSIRTYGVGKRHIDLCWKCFQVMKRINGKLKDIAHENN